MAWKGGIILLFALYPRACELSVRALACLPLADGSERLGADIAVDCEDFGPWRSYASIMIVILSVGVPLAIGMRLRQYRDVLYNEHGERDKRGRPVELSPTVAWQLGFLYREYDADYYWYEVVEFVKKFLLCGGLLLVAPGSPTQFIVAIMFCFAYAMFVAFLEPYADQSDDLVAVLCSVSTWLALSCPLLPDLTSPSLPKPAGAL